MAVAAQEPGQTNAIGAAALDREDMDLAERTRPGEELGVAIIVGVENFGWSMSPPTPSMATATCWSLWVSTPTMTSPRSSAMLAMTVDPLAGSMVEPPAGREGQDCDGTWFDQAPMRSLPVRLAVHYIAAAGDRHVNARTRGRS